MEEIPQTTSTSAALSPTAEAYGELQQAYTHFNHTLFGDALPYCLLTMQRRSRRTLGYFCHARFSRHDGATTDEIALNPQHFKTRSVEEVLSTLVHEMCHLWQDHFGTRRSRSGYHNKEWANKMKEAGLQPSDTGKPGGKETGQQMTHFCIEGGQFLLAVRELLSTAFRVSWHEHVAVQEEGGGAGSPDPHPGRSGKRVKFTCPGCQAHAWGKDSLKLVCGECSLVMRTDVIQLAQLLEDDKGSAEEALP
jgi:predicted SprT family Zn-dependent metalloprotease